VSSVISSPRIQVPADPSAMFARLYDMGVTDGLPVIAPTDDLIDAFVAAAGMPASHVVAQIEPLMGAASVEKIAINAIMAGCLPQYMPVVMTALEAMADPAFNLLCLQTTTNPAAPLVIVNGPIRHRLDINCGRNALGPGRRANATIGRALRLVMLNIGGATPGEVDKATLGMPGKYTMCLGENEEDSPWAPYHVDQGFAREQSTVTVVGVQGNQNIYTPWKKSESILRALSSAMMSLAANNTQRARGHVVMIVNPGHAKLLDEQGIDKVRLQHELWERSGIPADQLPQEPAAIDEGHRKMVNGRSMVTAQPEDIRIVVAGGPEAYHNTYCENLGDSSVTKPIRNA
jgi:hypothetical protein